MVVEVQRVKRYKDVKFSLSKFHHQNPDILFSNDVSPIFLIPVCVFYCKKRLIFTCYNVKIHPLLFTLLSEILVSKKNADKFLQRSKNRVRIDQSQTSTDKSQTTTDESQMTTDESQTTTYESQTILKQLQMSHRRQYTNHLKVFMNPFMKHYFQEGYAFPNAPMI